YLSRAGTRASFGAPQYHPPSRFLDEIPPEVITWERSDRDRMSAAGRPSASVQQGWGGGSTRGSSAGVVRLNPRGSGVRRPIEPISVAAADRVNHDSF